MGNCVDEDDGIQQPGHGNNEQSFFGKIGNAMDQLGNAFQEGFNQGMNQNQEAKKKKKKEKPAHDQYYQGRHEQSNPTSYLVQTSDEVAVKYKPSNFEGPPYQKWFLQEIRQTITSKQQLQAVLPKFFIDYIFDMYANNYWSTDTREQFIKKLLAYIKFSVSQISKNVKNQTPYTLEKFGQKFGKELYKLFNEVRMKNTWVKKTLGYDSIFMRKSFDIKNEQQITKTANQVKNMCANSTVALVYLSSYFVKCCLKLQKAGTPISKINELLKPQVTKMKQLFSPKSKLQQQQKIKKQLQKGKAVQKVKTIESQKFPYKNRTLVFKTDDKQQEIDNLIMEMVALGVKHYSSFTQLTSSCCMEYDGFGYKSNLKLKQRTQKMPMLRVKQKLLKSNVSQFYKDKKYDCKNIQQQRKAQVTYIVSVLQQVYSKMSSIQFTVSDILRGKCMFNKISQIVSSTQSIINKVAQRAAKGENIQIVEIDNRLSGITNDLVLKIRMQDIVCEFQLALKFNQAQNQIHHKMYEVQRSKVFTPVTMLFIWHDSISSQYFYNLDNIINGSPLKKKDEVIKRSNKLKQFIQTKIQVRIPLQIQASKKDIEYITNIKNQINNMVVPAEVSKLCLFRSSKALSQMKKFNQAISEMTKFLKNNSTIPQPYLALGNYYKQTGSHLKAVQNYQKCLQIASSMQQDKYLLQELMSGLAQSFWELGKNEEAQKILTQLLGIQKQAFGQQSKQNATTLSNMGIVQNRLGHFKQAVKYHQKALQIFKKLKLDQYSRYPETYQKLSNVYIQMGLLSKAQQQLNKGLSISEHMMGKQSMQSAHIMLCMGRVYCSMGKFQQAQQNYQKYLVFCQNLMTRQSMNYAQGLYLISDLYTTTGRYKQSEKALQACADIVRKTSGQQSNDFMQVLNNYGLYYVTIGKYQQGIQVFNRCIQILENIGNTESPNVATICGNLAQSYQRKGDIETAAQYYQKQAQITQIVFGSQSTQYAFLLNNACNVASLKGNLDKALQFLLKAVDIYEKNGSQDQGYMATLASLGQIYLQKFDKVNGLKYYEKALKLYELVFGKNHQKCVEMRQKLKNVDKMIQFYRNPNWRQINQQYIEQQKQKKDQQLELQERKRVQEVKAKNKANGDDNDSDIDWDEVGNQFGTFLGSLW